MTEAADVEEPRRSVWARLGGSALRMGLHLHRLLEGHSRIVGALIMREITTRFGRENLSFFWLVLEPLLFTLGVMALWTAMKPPYEHGMPVAAFVMTGYMPLVLLRHFVSRSVLAIRSNSALLYHRQVTLLHVFFARIFVEFVGATIAFIIAAAGLMWIGVMDPPANLSMIYAGWMLLAFLSLGVSLVICAVSEMSEAVERITGLLNYLLIPISGAFFMSSWLPEGLREVVMTIPVIHCFELIRGGFFGPVVVVHYDVGYVLVWILGLTLLGLMLLEHVRRHTDVV